MQESEAGLEEDKHEIPLSEKTEEDLSGKARPDSQMVSPVRMDDYTSGVFAFQDRSKTFKQQQKREMMKKNSSSSVRWEDELKAPEAS